MKSYLSLLPQRRGFQSRSATWLIVPISIMLALFVENPSFGASITGLFNTGIDPNGVLAAHGTVDGHYVLVSVPPGVSNIVWVPTAIPSEPAASPWLQVDAGAYWVSPESDATVPLLAGTYDYRLTFTMTDDQGDSLNPATASVIGNWATDNNGILLLNGIPMATNDSLTEFMALTNFTLTNGFQFGTNTLDFVVVNLDSSHPNPTGLLVSSLAGTAEPINKPTSANIAFYPGITITGTLGAPYTIQYTTSLNPPVHWITLTNFNLPTTPFIFYDPQPAAANPQRFYRALTIH